MGIWIPTSTLISLESLILQKINKGVEGRGDFSIRILLCSMIAEGYWDARMWLEHNGKTMTSLLMSKRNVSHQKGGFDRDPLDLSVSQKRIWQAHHTILFTIR